MIELNNIHVKSILKGLDLSLSSGEFVILLGGNGAGKTTLMNVLAGDMVVSQGQISLQGNEITHWPTRKRARHIARIFQDPLLGTFGRLTIEENLTLAQRRGCRSRLRLYRQPHQQEKFRELLSLLGMGLENRLQQQVATLSGGQRQALSLVMAVIQEAKLLLLDEHTAALDPKTAKDIMAITAQFVAKKTLTTLMITHSLAQALEYGDRLVILNQGQIVKEYAGLEKNRLSTHDLLSWFM